MAVPGAQELGAWPCAYGSPVNVPSRQRCGESGFEKVTATSLLDCKQRCDNQPLCRSVHYRAKMGAWCVLRPPCQGGEYRAGTCGVAFSVKWCVHVQFGMQGNYTPAIPTRHPQQPYTGALFRGCMSNKQDMKVVRVESLGGCKQLCGMTPGCGAVAYRTIAEKNCALRRRCTANNSRTQTPAACPAGAAWCAHVRSPLVLPGAAAHERCELTGHGYSSKKCHSYSLAPVPGGLFGFLTRVVNSVLSWRCSCLPSSAARLSQNISSALRILDVGRRENVTRGMYVPLATGCKSIEESLGNVQASSLEECKSVCDSTCGCLTAVFNPSKLQSDLLLFGRIVTVSCELKRQCDDVLVGDCITKWCAYTRGPTSRKSFSLMHAQTTARKARLTSVRERAQHQLTSLAQHPVSTVNGSLCNARPALSKGTVIDMGYGRSWRYYTAFPCSNSHEICLAAKKTGGVAVLVGAISRDGIHFRPERDLLRLGTDWSPDMFTHNMAILPQPHGEFIMIGGMQGFISNATCRDEQRRLGYNATRAKCLQEVSGSDMPGRRQSRRRHVEGIRLTRGSGLPYHISRWSPPQVVITGSEPGGCVDRRPKYTGYPRLQACEFDGRLSLVHLDKRYRLYARANLRYQALVGGRFVQTSTSSTMQRGTWSRWELVRILAVDMAAVDLYFFAVQANPVHTSSLVALFPVSQPPKACIAMAFSMDGVSFSRPVVLHASRMAARTHDRQFHGTLEWRGEDHPVAGVVRVPGNVSSRQVLFYIHHAVKGVTTRKDATPHVAAYRMTIKQLSRLTRRGLRQLS